MVKIFSLMRNYCLGKFKDDKVFSEWMEEIEYLDELGSVIYIGKGVCIVELGFDDYVMLGGVKKFFLNVLVVVKIVEVVKRWKWGLEMEN